MEMFDIQLCACLVVCCMDNGMKWTEGQREEVGKSYEVALNRPYLSCCLALVCLDTGE